MTTEIRFDSVHHEIIRVTGQLVQCTTALQAAPYEQRLRQLCNSVLAKGEDGDIEAALSYFKNAEPADYCYERLLVIAEDCAETVVDEKGAAVLMLIPIMTWSRYRNYYGVVDEDVLEGIADSVRENFTSPKARVIMGSHILSADHLPDAFRTPRRMLERMRDLSHGSAFDVSPLIGEVPPPDFSDPRYLFCCVAADKPEELFRAQNETIIDVGRGMMNFCLKTHELLEFTMLGSVFEVQPAGGFYHSWRESEALMRTWGLKALVDFAGSMGYEPKGLIATLTLFVPNARDTDKTCELRIGLTPKNARDHVICGIAWPGMPQESDAYFTSARDTLEAKDVNDIVEQEQTFSLEWCDDCGAPLYVTPDGLVVHVELTNTQSPEDFAPTLN